MVCHITECEEIDLKSAVRLPVCLLSWLVGSKEISMKAFMKPQFLKTNICRDWGGVLIQTIPVVEENELQLHIYIYLVIMLLHSVKACQTYY